MSVESAVDVYRNLLADARASEVKLCQLCQTAINAWRNAEAEVAELKRRLAELERRVAPLEPKPLYTYPPEQPPDRIVEWRMSPNGEWRRG